MSPRALIRYIVVLVAALQNVNAMEEEYPTAGDFTRFGVFVGDLIGELGVTGGVYLADSTHIYIRQFNLNDNANPSLRSIAVNGLWEIRTTYDGEQYRIPLDNLAEATPGADVVIEVEQQTWYQLEILSNQAQAAVVFRGNLVANGNAEKRTLDSLSTLYAPYNVGSGTVTVVDTKTVRVEEFTFTANGQPDTAFMGGVLPVHPRGALKLLWQLRAWQNNRICGIELMSHDETEIIITLPFDMTVYDIDYISVYCYRYFQDFGNTQFMLTPKSNPVPVYLPPIQENAPVLETCNESN